MKISLFLLAIIGCAFATSPAHSGESTSHAVPLKSYLLTMGDKLDCYFTIERDDSGPHKIDNFTKLSLISTALITDDAPIVSVNDLVTKLKKDLPNTVFSTTQQGSKHIIIVHLTDASLLKQPDYVLNQKVTVQYSGLLKNFPDALGAKLQNRISQVQTYTWGELMGSDQDTTTVCSVDENNSTVREILTNAVPTPYKSRILWNAEERTQDHGLEVWVRYYKKMLSSEH